MSELNAPTAMEVQQIMTQDLTTAIATQEIIELHNLFEKVPYHHIPIVEGKRLIGILSDRDITKCVSSYFKQQQPIDNSLRKTTVAEIMSTNLITVDRTTNINFASILLLEHNISCLPVVDEDNNLQGILTWKDILRFHVYFDAA